MRFIIEGRGGFTAVQGRRLRMARGDVILTPTWHWHDHGNDDDHGSSPLIWLDGLDLPNFQHFPVHFVEHYAAGPRYPAEDVDTSKSPLVFPWARMKKALDAVEGDSAELRYLHEDGSEGEWSFVFFFSLLLFFPAFCLPPPPPLDERNKRTKRTYSRP